MAEEKSGRNGRKNKIPKSYLWKAAEKITQKTSSSNGLADINFSNKICEFVFCNRGYTSVAVYAVILLIIITFIYTIWKIVSPHSSRSNRRPGSNGLVKIRPSEHVGTGKSDESDEGSSMIHRFHLNIEQIPNQLKKGDISRHRSPTKNVLNERVGPYDLYLGKYFKSTQYNGYYPTESNGNPMADSQPTFNQYFPFRPRLPNYNGKSTFRRWGPLVRQNPVTTEAPTLQSPALPRFYTNTYEKARPTEFDPNKLSATTRYPYRSVIWPTYKATSRPSNSFDNENSFPSRRQTTTATMMGKYSYLLTPKPPTVKFYKEIKYFGSEDQFHSRPLQPSRGGKLKDVIKVFTPYQTAKKSENYPFQNSKTNHGRNPKMKNHKPGYKTRSNEKKHSERPNNTQRKSKEKTFTSSKRSKLETKIFPVKNSFHYQHKQTEQKINPDQKQFHNLAGYSESKKIEKKNLRSEKKNRSHKKKLVDQTKHFRQQNRNHLSHRRNHYNNVYQQHHHHQKHTLFHRYHHRRHRHQYHLNLHQYYHLHHQYQDHRQKHHHHEQRHYRNLRNDHPQHLQKYKNNYQSNPFSFSRPLRHSPLIDYNHYQQYRRHHSVNDELKGRWISSKHRIKSCKTIRTFQTSGTVKMSKNSYRRNGKTLYTVLACSRVRLRLRKHRHKKWWKKGLTRLAQLCRKSWFITTGFLQLKRDSKQNISYRVIICNPSFTTKLDLTNSKEISFVWQKPKSEKQQSKISTRKHHLNKISTRKHHAYNFKSRKIHIHLFHKKKSIKNQQNKKKVLQKFKLKWRNKGDRSRKQDTKHHKGKSRTKIKIKYNILNLRPNRLFPEKVIFTKLLEMMEPLTTNKIISKKKEKKAKLTQIRELLSKLKTQITRKSHNPSSTQRKLTEIKAKNKSIKIKSQKKIHLSDSVQEMVERILPSVIKSVKADLQSHFFKTTKKPIIIKTKAPPTAKPISTTKQSMVNLNNVVKNLLPLILKNTGKSLLPTTKPTTKSTPKPTTKPTTLSTIRITNSTNKSAMLNELLTRLGLNGINLNSLKGSVKPARDVLEKQHTVSTVATTLHKIVAPYQPTTLQVNRQPKMLQQRTVTISPLVSPTKSSGSNFLNDQNFFSSENFNQDQKQIYRVRRNILCFGDSITKGYTGRGKPFHPYSIHLSKLLNGIGHSVHYDVTTSGKMREMAHGSMNQRLPMVLGNNTKLDWVIILGGTNDVAHVKNFGDDDSFMGQLVKVWSPRIVKDIENLHETAHRYGARTVLVTIPESAYESWSKFRILLYMRNAINAQLRQYASQSQGQTILCDMARAIPRMSMSPDMQARIWSDHLHLTAYGYDLLAQFIYKCIKPHLR